MGLRLILALAVVSSALWGQMGTVKSDGQPLPGATVRATLADRVLITLTDPRGEYKFENLTPGAWVFDVAMFGFAPGRKEVQIGTSTAKIDFSLELAPFPVGFGRGGGFGGGGRGGFGGAGSGVAAFGRGGAGGGQATGQNGQGAQGFRRGGPQSAGSQNQTDANAPATNTNGVAEAGAGFAGDNNAPDTPVDNGALAQVNASGANESFLVNGSLSGGLQTQAADFGPGGSPGGFPGGPNTNAAFGGAQIPGQAAAPGQGTGPGGFGGAGDGFGGGGFGGGGFGGDRGGFGPGGRGGRGGFPGGGGFIGNRRNRGQNQIRGSVFYTVRNSALDAASFSVNGQNGTKASYTQNRFGFNLGGPLEFPKWFRSETTFFTLNYNGNLADNGVNLTSTVPTLLERAGDFSQLTGIMLVNPSIQNNRLTRVDPIAQGLLAFIPIPNQPGTVNNYRLVASVPNNSENMNIRVNQSLTRREQLTFGVNWQTRNAHNLQNFGFTDETAGAGIGANFGYRHTFGARMFNNLTATFNRNSSLATPFFADGMNIAGQLGIQGTSSNPLNFGPPNLSFTNFAGLNDGSPSQSAIYNVGFNDTFSVRRGRHNWSSGAGYTRYFNNTITDSNGRGTFLFTGLATSSLNDKGQPLASTGFDFADFLLGAPQSNSIRFGSSDTYFRSNAYNLFVQDDFRARNNLTLNLGLRYEYFAPWHEKYGRIANLAIAPGFAAATVVTPNSPGVASGLLQPDRNNFGPRTSLAWKPNVRKSLVIRTGYGIYYNPGIYNQFMSRLAAQPPFANSTSVITSISNPLNLATGLKVMPNGKSIFNTFAVDTNYRTMYAQTWNINVQTSLPKSLVGEISYLGTKGTRLDIQESPNQALPGPDLSAQDHTVIGNTTGFTYDAPAGSSIYHAAQARLTRRFRGSLSGNLLYTFAKSIDNSSTLGGAGNTVAQNFQNLAAERGLSSFDRRQAFTANFVVGSPIGGTSSLLANHGIWTAVLKDWTLSPSITLQTGMPLTARVLGNQSDIAGTGTLGSGRANATGQPVDAGSGYFNLAAFVRPTPGQYGNAGRNTIPGPGIFTANLSLQRTITLAERKRLQIRMDANNVTNHVNITSFGTVVNSINYGVATSAGAMRSLSLTMRFNF